jgi:hypothetical protein
VRWWDHGFRGEDVGRVLFDVIFGGDEDDILSLVVSSRSMCVCVSFVFGDVLGPSAKVRVEDARGNVDAGSSPQLVATA